MSSSSKRSQKERRGPHQYYRDLDSSSDSVKPNRRSESYRSGSRKRDYSYRSHEGKSYTTDQIYPGEENSGRSKRSNISQIFLSGSQKSGSNKRSKVSEKRYKASGNDVPYERNINPTKKQKCHKCSICDKEYPYPSYLKRHMESKHRKKIHICGQCQATFNSVSLLNHHISTTHTSGPKHTCSLCGKEYKHKSSLDYHIFSKH